MPLDINAFRAIANQSPDKYIYAQGETLKASKSDSRHAAHTYKAAAEAFDKAFEDHYGKRLADAIKTILDSENVKGKPLTARTIKALVDFADETAGSAKKIDIGGKAVNLEKIGTDKMTRVGFRHSTKIAKAQAGQKATAADVLAAFMPDASGKVDLKHMLRHVNTFREYIGREIAADGQPDEAKEAKLFDKGLFLAVDALDNNTLSDVYQGLISGQTDALKKELNRILNHPDAKPAVRRLAERMFADISRIEAMVLSEISRRMDAEIPHDGEKGDMESPMERYVGENAQSSNKYGGEKDMSTLNLGIVARNAAQGANSAKVSSSKTDAALRNAGMDKVDAKKIGDMMRSQELTINMRFSTFMGKRKDGSQGLPALMRPNARVMNVFESLEEQGADTLRTGDLKHRSEVEKCFFPEYGAKPLSGRDRPVYGALNTSKLTSGGADTHIGAYGRVVVVVKPHVKRRCTYALDDTFFATRVSMPESRRAEIEENLVKAFASRLKDPAAALAGLRDPENLACRTLGKFFKSMGENAQNMGAQQLDSISGVLASFLKGHLAPGAAEITDEDIIAHFLEKYALAEETRRQIADYDHLENLLSHHPDFTAVSMATSTLRQQENPKSPFAMVGMSYIEAQFHGPVLFNRDVEEIRFDLEEMEGYCENEFNALPEDERNAVLNDPKRGGDEDERVASWVKARCKELKKQIQRDTAFAPFKVTFYDHGALDPEAMKVSEEMESLAKESVSLLKNDLQALGDSFLGERSGELKAKVAQKLAVSASGSKCITDMCGTNLEHIPGWLWNAIEGRLHDEISNYGTNVDVTDEATAFADLTRVFFDTLMEVSKTIAAMDKAGIDTPAEREALVKEVLKLRLVVSDRCESIVTLHCLEKEMLADVNVLAREVFEKDIEDGAELLENAFGGVPPLAGRAKELVEQCICREILSIKRETQKSRLEAKFFTREALAGRIRKNAVKPFIEKKARIMQEQVFMRFPSAEERKAFLKWATSAGQLKNNVQLEGVYESSTILTDNMEKLLKGPMPVDVKDIVDLFKSFYPTCFSFMEQDAKATGGDYGPDDRATFVNRSMSVALSRLAVRVGREGMAKLAEAMNTPEMRQLHVAVTWGVDSGVEDSGNPAGCMEAATAFIDKIYDGLAEAGFKVYASSAPNDVDYRMVNPVTRLYVAEINSRQAAAMNKAYPYDPENAGARSLDNIPAPANPAAMPRSNAQRKRFLLEMLPIYHNHEKTFDDGTNYHGRTHATRAFVFSIAMANILKSKGVKVDMNAVALGTAGHDTGRINNGRDTRESETRSAETTNAAIDRLYPNAAGEEWKNRLLSNITTQTDKQTTVEGYLFKSADSLDYTRIDELDPKEFPFLKESIVTDDGIIVEKDDSMRRQLMKEARLLSELTDRGAQRSRELQRVMKRGAELDEANASEEEIMANEQIREEIVADIAKHEREQTASFSDAQIVNLVEETIRSRPEDFPLLTKYYLNAEQED